MTTKNISYCSYCGLKCSWIGEENSENVNTHIKEKHIGISRFNSYGF